MRISYGAQTPPGVPAKGVSTPIEEGTVLRKLAKGTVLGSVPILACLVLVLVAAPASGQWTWKSAQEAGIDLPKRWGLDVTG